MKKLKCSLFSLDTVESNPHCRKIRMRMHHPMSHPPTHENREQRWNVKIYGTGLKTLQLCHTKVTSCQLVSHPWCQNVTCRDTKCFQNSLKCKLLFNWGSYDVPVGGKCKLNDPHNDTTLGKEQLTHELSLFFHAYVILLLSLAPIRSFPGWVVSYFSVNLG